MKNVLLTLHTAFLYTLLHFGCCENYVYKRTNNCGIWNITCMYEVTCINYVDVSSDIFINRDRCENDIYYSDNNYHPVNLIYKYNSDDEESIPYLHNYDIIMEITTVLDISENQLYNQPNIKEMLNLEKINLSHNNLPEARFYNFNYELRSLKAIDFSYNVITTLDVDENEYIFEGLKEINLSHNHIHKISDLKFKKFNNLQYLDLSNNQISDIISNTFEGISGLKYLNLSFNNIIDINTSLFRFQNLIELNLSNNEMGNLVKSNFNNLHELKVLDLNHNSVSSVDNDVFDDLPRLETLDLSTNNLHMLGSKLFSETNLLNNINLSYNNITRIPKNMFLRKNISMFSIKGNNITGSLERGLFEGLDSITDLDISHQSVTSIGNYSFFGLIKITKLLLNDNFINFLSAESFITLNSLRILDLSSNRIKNIDFVKSDLVNLNSLVLSNNLIEKINADQLFYLHRLQYLDLSQNKITHLQPKSFQSLSSLDSFLISKNPLTGTLEENTFDGLFGVPLLDLSGTSLNSIKNNSFDGMMHLYDLNISHCKISEIQYNSFSNTENIETIDLSYNNLDNFAINTSHVKSLKNLRLNNNIIKTLSQNFVKGLSLLNTLVLSHNSLLTLHSDTFQDQKMLKYLDLSFNLNFNFDFSLLNYTSNLDTLILSGTLSNMTFKGMKEMPLTQLDISNSNIHNITFLSLQKVKNIEILSLANNNITQIEFGAFSNLDSITEIDVSYNGIKSIEPGVFKDCHHLRALNISHNSLSVIRYGIFKGSAHLNVLDISYNYISNLEIAIFNDLPHLSELLVDHNRISEVSAEDLRGTEIKKISIGDNPLPCQSLIDLIRYSPQLRVTSIRNIESEDNHHGIACNYYKHIPKRRILKTEISKNNETMSENLLIDIRDILFNISDKNIQSDDKSIINDKYDFQKSVQSLTDNMKLLNNISINIEKENKNTNQYLERLLKLIAATNSFRPEISKLPGNMKNDINKNEVDKLKVEIDNNIIIEKEKILAEVGDKLSIINQRIDSLIHSTTLPPVNEHRTLTKEREASSSALIEICVVLILIILVCFVLYKVYKSKCYIVNRLSASTRHISEMENSNL